MNLSRYHELRDRFQTGDVIAFAGAGGVGSFIRSWVSEPVSHVGQVLRDELTDRIWIVEATIDEGVNGVQQRLLSHVLSRSTGKAWLVPLAQPLTTLERQELEHFFEGEMGKPYDPLGAGHAGTGAAHGWRRVLGWVALDWWREPLTWAFGTSALARFCSELIVAGLQKLGILPAVLRADAEDITPYRLVSGFGCFGAPIPLHRPDFPIPPASPWS